MRILASADVHGVNVVYEWLTRLACHDVDALVLAGDLLASDFEAEQRKQASSIIGLLKTVPVPVLYIMGNDDNVSLDYEDDLVKPLHARRLELGGFAFVGYQYTPPFCGDKYVKPEEEIARDMEWLEPLLDEKTILVTHTPARGHLDESFGENTGSGAIAAALNRRPVLAHIHGHIHQMFGRDGIHFNVASAGRSRAMLIELPALFSKILQRGE